MYGNSGRPSFTTILQRLAVLLVPAGLLMFGSYFTNDHTRIMLWTGAVFQVLLLCLLVVSHRAWHQPVGFQAIIAYLIAVAWLWSTRGKIPDWYLHLAQFVLLVVPLTLFAFHMLNDSGAFAGRRAHLLVQRLVDRTDWPANLSDCRTLPEVKALREALMYDASPALALLGHPRTEVRLAALSALEFRKQWWPGQPELVLRFAKQSKEPLLRIAAVTALGNIDDRSLIESLGEFLRDSNRDVRRAAADAIFWDIERRWGWIRLQVRHALAESTLHDDGALQFRGPPLSAEAVADLTAWATEKGVLGNRSALTLAEHFSRTISSQPGSQLVQTLKQRLVSTQTPAALRIELAQLLRANNALDPAMQFRLVDPGNPAPLRLLAAELLLSSGPCVEAVNALREIARMHNREMALAAAEVVQRRLGVDLGLAINQPLPPLHSRLAADVSRRLMRWAELDDEPTFHREDTKLDTKPKSGSGVFDLGPSSRN